MTAADETTTSPESGEGPSANVLKLFAAAATDPRPIIRVGADVHRVVDQAIAALSTDSTIYQRGGQLIRVVDAAPSARDRVARAPGVPTIVPLTSHAIVDALSRSAQWQRPNKHTPGQWIPVSPPKNVADMLLSRAQWGGVRTLVGISVAPVVRPDGTIATAPGYDEATGYIVATDAALEIADRPTYAEAVSAAERLYAVMEDFPWKETADYSAWLALALTLVCRPAIAGPTPLFVVTANIRGAGKSRSVDVPALTVTGRPASRATLCETEEEWGKTLTGIAMAADPLVAFDNAVGPVASGKLDAFLTGEVWNDRILGGNARFIGEITTVLAVTGNNLDIRGDTIRRVLPIRFDSDEERPEARTNFRLPDLLGHVREHREKLLADLLTIARGWYAAGSPRKTSAMWGSFEAWTRTVPPMLTWVGLPDPQLTRAGLEEDDPTIGAWRSIVATWATVEASAGTVGLTVRELLGRVYSGEVARTGMEDMAAALETIAPGRGRERVDARGLGYRLRAMKGRNLGGKRLQTHAGTASGGLRWTVR